MEKRSTRLPVGRIVTGDCVRTMARWPAGSVDAIVTSPPYPLIERAYGRWTEPQWLLWMPKVVAACNRLLKPTGSMVFVIGPTFRRVGQLGPWPYRFVADVLDAGHNVVQDAYWVDPCRLPIGGVQVGLMRSSVLWCVWIGPPDCYRNAKDVLWEHSDKFKQDLNRMGKRAGLMDGGPTIKVEGVKITPAGQAIHPSIYRDRGGASPMNALVAHNSGRHTAGHPAAFPETLAAFWVKYICPPGGVVLDPFAGSGTTCAAAAKHGRRWAGIERVAAYARRARVRIRKAASNRRA